MAYHVFEREQVLDLPPEQVFDFFRHASNLERITPPSAHFGFESTPPAELAVGVEVRHRLRVAGWPVRWVTRITEWDPPHRFADLQAGGPFAYWLHTHTFTAAGPGRTLMRDRVVYRVAFGALGEIARRAFVEPQMRSLFDHRERTIPAVLGTT